MRAEAVSLLGDEPARRLLATWTPAAEAWKETREAGEPRRILDLWAETAGVDLRVVLRFGMPLLRSGLCLDDGTIAPELGGSIEDLGRKPPDGEKPTGPRGVVRPFPGKGPPAAPSA